MRALSRTFLLLDRTIAGIESAVIVLVFLLMTALSALQVLGRQFDLPTTWTLELGAYLLVWLIFTGASLGVRTWQHVRFDVLLDMVPARARRVADVAIEICVLGFAVFLALSSIALVRQQLAWGQQTATLPVNVSIAFTAVIVPISAIFMIIHVGQRLLAEKGTVQDEQPIHE